MKGSSFLKDTYSSLDKGSKYVVVKIKKFGWKTWLAAIVVAAAVVVAVVLLTRPEHAEEEIPVVAVETVTTQDVNLYGEYQAGTEVGQRAPLVNFNAEDAEPDIIRKGGK